jgi:putative PEP-CTERM system TPR-repeat lipoprotein
MKSILTLIVIIIALSPLSGCSSPEEKAAAHLASGDAFFEKNDLSKAQIEYKNALQLNQNLTGAWYGLARTYEQKQQWQSAYKILIGIRDRHPRYMNGRIMLAKILLASNEIDQATEDARDVVELAPDDARAHSIMAAVQFRLGDHEAAWESVEHALALDPDNPEAILMKATMLATEEKFKESLDILNTALLSKPDNVLYHLMKVRIYGTLDDQSAIEQTYRTLSELFPEDTSYKHSLILHYVQSGNFEQAELLLAQNIGDNPENIEEKIRYISFKSQYRSIDESIALVKTYIKQDPSEYRFKFILGEFYLRSNHLDKATVLYQGIMEDDGLQPNGLKARNQLAEIYIWTDKRSESRALIDEVLAHDKNNEVALLLQSRFLLDDGKYDEAIINLRTVLRDNPASGEAHGLIGQAQLELGAISLAIESYTKALSINPAAAEFASPLANLLIQNNKPGQADEMLQNSIRAGNQSVETLKFLIQAKLILGELEQAEQLAQRLKSIEGEEALGQQVLGLVYRGKEQPDESIEAFKRAYELAPQTSLPMAALVMAYLQNNKIDEARKFLHSVVAENPENFSAYQLLGAMSMRENDVPAAIGYYEHVIRANPRLERGYLSLASIYTRDRKPQEAENILQTGLAELPDNLALTMNLALIVERKNDVDRAIDLYEEVLLLNPGMILAKNNLASLLADHREDQASLARAREIASEFRDSKVPQFRDTYAWASVRSGLYLQEAIVILEKIVRDNETVGLYHYHLGEAFRKSGNKYEARNSLRKAIEVEKPGSRVAVNATESLKLVSQ